MKELLHQIQSRPQREKLLVGGALLALLIWVFSDAWTGDVSSSAPGGANRISELVRLKESLERYKKLAVRAAQIERTYARAQVTTEEVFSEVEKIIRESIGGDGYELRPSPNPISMSPTMEQQLFTLRLRSVTLEQLVAVLYKLEQGKAPLFLGKVEVSKTTPPGNFVATVELSSLRRKRDGNAS